MSDAAIAKGRHPGFADVAIAALAQHAGLLLLTCNLKHFEPLGVACADPLITLPA
jgi:predicted nucleic acid-binding protein